MSVSLAKALYFFDIVDDFGNASDFYSGEYGSRAVLNAIYFAFPGESYYWGVSC